MLDIDLNYGAPTNFMVSAYSNLVKQGNKRIYNTHFLLHTEIN